MKKSDFNFNENEAPLYWAAGALAVLILVFALAYHLGNLQGWNEAREHIKSLETESPVYNRFYDYLENKKDI